MTGRVAAFVAAFAVLGLAPPVRIVFGGGGALAAEPAAPFTVVAGDGIAGFADGPDARFDKPIRLAPFADEAVVVADIFNHAIRLVRLDGEVTTLAGHPDRKGYEDGPASSARFASPHGVAVSASGAIAVAEAENHTIRLMTPDPDEGWVVSTLAGTPGESGMRDGPAAEALFASPHAVAWTAGGGLLVADIGNRRIRLVENGRVRTVAGSGELGNADGPADRASFHYPMDIALGSDGSVFVADAGNHLIRRWTPEDDMVGTVALSGALDTPHGITVSSDGSGFVADMGTSRVLRVDAQGAVHPVVGTGEAGGGPGELDRPAAVLAHGRHLWIADLDNHRIVVVPLGEAN